MFKIQGLESPIYHHWSSNICTECRSMMLFILMNAFFKFRTDTHDSLQVLGVFHHDEDSRILLSQVHHTGWRCFHRKRGSWFDEPYCSSQTRGGAVSKHLKHGWWIDSANMFGKKMWIYLSALIQQPKWTRMIYAVKTQCHDGQFRKLKITQ